MVNFTSRRCSTLSIHELWQELATIFLQTMYFPYLLHILGDSGSVGRVFHRQCFVLYICRINNRQLFGSHMKNRIFFSSDQENCFVSSKHTAPSQCTQIASHVPWEKTTTLISHAHLTYHIYGDVMIKLRKEVCSITRTNLAPRTGILHNTQTTTLWDFLKNIYKYYLACEKVKLPTSGYDTK